MDDEGCTLYLLSQRDRQTDDVGMHGVLRCERARERRTHSGGRTWLHSFYGRACVYRGELSLWLY